MNLKEQLCKEFCEGLLVRDVPIGLAVGTEYQSVDGDHIGFYIQSIKETGKYRIIDNALSIPTLEALGADVEKNGTRKEVFETLLNQYGVQFDTNSGELFTQEVSEPDVPHAALQFLAFLLRVQDIAFMSHERAASTFKQDALEMLKQVVGNRADIVEDNFILGDNLDELPADAGILAKGKPPVAVFFGVSDNKVNEAMLLQAWALNASLPCSVVALLESEGQISSKVRQRANNHLDAVPIYEENKQQSIIRVASEALGQGFYSKPH
ncbi:DUF1828 domain-containing protein [Wenzhouxiangella sp. EGI_FJ10305]|uniref:DUF1828 domain-containing protein n=1 Tax=Wenzhouxiangella sp. EGI_FJ10305 TaxID=3243768 RepID=UPI0035E0471A